MKIPTLPGIEQESAPYHSWGFNHNVKALILVSRVK